MAQNNNEPIWFNKQLSTKDLSGVTPDTMGQHLGMEFVDIGVDFLKMRMPVDQRTHQPYGLLHGGASCALAETVGSVASFLVIDTSKFICVGLEINANHLRGIRTGFVTATATPLHLGGTTHVWDIKIQDEEEKLVCVSRLTVAILVKKSIVNSQ
ncbi:hotdog fold thioesterase [Ferruginibacter sp. HRS2-29]|uniref:hotdog fold thioesterase n=1 Tax=Ferruginibacter sp. HRS2-29 TaxID=2487334 RepID=UPI0020CE0F9C|nr:hotdog fold thioesterase [Ferruginibacter sp. HRS2-29]MCP9753402.1 hotdog fold thioesterase [Ferruginibacter sp. HRS2-29]